jgi:hypothetical protein
MFCPPIGLEPTLGRCQERTAVLAVESNARAQSGARAHQHWDLTHNTECQGSTDIESSTINRL